MPAPAPAAPADTTTDRRYPVLPSATPSGLPALGGTPFYPTILPYEPGQPVPTGYHVEHRSANGFIAGGATTLIVSYIAAFAVGANEGFKNGTGWTVVPVIGPWAAIGGRGYKCDTNVTPENAVTKTNTCVNGAFNEVQTIAILSADAVVQATGAVLLIIGLSSGRDELVRDDFKAGVRFTPRAVGNNGFGLGIDGRF